MAKNPSPQQSRAAARAQEDQEVVSDGIAHVHASFNNRSSHHRRQGNRSRGEFRRRRLQGLGASHPFAAQVALKRRDAPRRSTASRTSSAHHARPAASRRCAAERHRIRVLSIQDITPVRTTAWRPPKKRRV